MDTQTIPVIDLQRFTHGDADDQRAFVSALGEAVVEYGFVAVANHDVPPAAIGDGYAAVKALFDLPEATKRRYERPDINRQRGYTAFGQEHAKHRAVGDLKEFWHVGAELPTGHPAASLLPGNVWPTEVPTFRPAMDALWASMHAVGVTLLRALARYLGAAEETFVDMVDGGNTVLRLIHYPPPAPALAAKGGVWAAEHEDINLITLLPEATDRGLELLRRDGSWLPVAPVPGQLIADTGDMIQRLTNGVLPATTHRVLAPPGAASARYSMPFFMHARPDWVLRPLPGTVTADNPRRWPEDITADAYLTQRLRAIGVAKADSGHRG